MVSGEKERRQGQQAQDQLVGIFSGVRGIELFLVVWSLVMGD